MKKREIKIEGVVHTHLSEDELYDKFIDFINSLDSTFGGGVCELGEDGEEIYKGEIKTPWWKEEAARATSRSHVALLKKIKSSLNPC